MKKILLLILCLCSFLFVSCDIELDYENESQGEDKIEDEIVTLSYLTPQSNEKTIVNLDMTKVSSYNTFAFNTAKEIMAENKNYFYSPSSFYMALSMVSEGSDGNTYEELKKVMGFNTLSELQEINNSLYLNNYYENDYGKSRMANSFWIDNSIVVKEDYINTLKDYYHATGYSCSISQALDEVANWINENTFDFLKVKKQDLEEFEDSQLILANTIYFKNQWTNPFNEYFTAENTFYVNQETTVHVDFMKHTVSSTYYQGKTFQSFSDRFANGNKITYILPNDDVTIQDCFNSELLSVMNQTMKCESVKVTYGLPKIKFQNSLDLISVSQSLGINDLFIPDVANLSKQSSTSLYVSNIKQIAGIEWDENGCEAAAITIIGEKAESDLEGKIINIILNKPFIYYMTDSVGEILFIGVIQNPKN